jgi:cell division septation protein DedD
MSRSETRRRPLPVPRSRKAGKGGTVIGIFIGLILGLTIAAAVAYYLGKSGLTTPPGASGAAKEAPRIGRSDLQPPGPAPEKPRFDFYKILPGGEEPKAPLAKGTEKAQERATDRATIDASKSAEPARTPDRFWLQAGAFASQADAENLRARLALSGWEATMQSVTQPDKSVRYRVRLGPYDNTDELNRVKTELGQRGFDVAVIKNP